MVYLQLLRIKHWVKNAFLFIPAFFSGELFSLIFSKNLLLGFLAFCLNASCIYIINDYRDIEADKIHPEKKNRPLASGKIKKNQALSILLILFTISVLIGFYVGLKFLFILGLYFILNLAYSFGLKKIAILDIFIVAAGFVLRIKAGGVITIIPISQWLMVMVFLLALFIAVAKRRDDVLIKEKDGISVRIASTQYNLAFLNVLQAILSAVIIVSYLMYTLSTGVMNTFGTYRLYYTTVFVMAGIIRYLQISLVERNTGSPVTLLYSDRFIQITLFLWLLSFYFIIYVPDIQIFHQQ